MIAASPIFTLSLDHEKGDVPSVSKLWHHQVQRVQMGIEPSYPIPQKRVFRLALCLPLGAPAGDSASSCIIRSVRHCSMECNGPGSPINRNSSSRKCVVASFLAIGSTNSPCRRSTTAARCWAADRRSASARLGGARSGPWRRPRNRGPAPPTLSTPDGPRGPRETCDWPKQLSSRLSQDSRSEKIHVDRSDRQVKVRLPGAQGLGQPVGFSPYLPPPNSCRPRGRE